MMHRLDVAVRYCLPARPEVIWAGECVVILYSGSHYGVFDLDEYSFILMKLKTDAKNRLAERIKTWNKVPPQLFN